MARCGVLLHPVKKRHETVVVALRDGVFLVIMATGAAHRHSHKNFRGDLHGVGKRIVFGQEPVSWFIVILAEAQKSGGRQARLSR